MNKKSRAKADAQFNAEIKRILEKLKKRGRAKEARSPSLPEKFHVSNYEEIKNWDFLDWFHALAFRRSLLMEWKERCENQREEDDIESFRFLRERTTQLLEDPLKFYREPSPFIDNAMREISLLDLTDLINHKTSIYATPGVDSAEDYVNDQIEKMEGIYHLPDLKDDDVRKVFKAKLVQRGNGCLGDEISDVLASLPASDFVDSFHSWPKYTIAINLEAPDSLILTQVKEWLRKTRNRTETPFFVNPIQRKELDKWVKYLVLPYIDLRLFSWAHGFELSMPEMHRYLVGASHKWPTEEALRKNTKITMEEILAPRYIRSLLYSTSPSSVEDQDDNAAGKKSTD
ncbi:DUF6387 family protein [Herbaspirillum sp. VT-16-41]|uniref:DUF6387 family protein n=1 Tax=Herbaspirillum sp. VT-16-41 TaxID=1953765 RepID=UPI00111573B8|nr:DUF6387 family protein [Herbaspirillum sp. VT-16-41]